MPNGQVPPPQQQAQLVTHDIGSGRPITIFRADPTSPYGRTPVETVSTGGTFYSINKEGDLGIYFKTPGEAQAYATTKGTPITSQVGVSDVPSSVYWQQKTAREEAAKAAYGGVRTAAALGEVGKPVAGSQLEAKVKFLERGTAQFPSEAQFTKATEEVGRIAPISAKGVIVTPGFRTGEEQLKAMEQVTKPIVTAPPERLYGRAAEINRQLGLGVLNEPKGKPIDVSGFPVIAVTPARPYIEPTKYTTQPLYDFTRTITEESEKLSERLYPSQPFEMPGIFPREFIKGAIKGAGSVPELFGTSIYGTEMMARDIWGGRGKEIPSRILAGTALMAEDIKLGFTKKPVETLGAFAGQAIVFEGLGRIPKPKGVRLPELKLSETAREYSKWILKELKPAPKTVESIKEYPLSQKMFGSSKSITLGETPFIPKDVPLFRNMFGTTEVLKRTFVVEEKPLTQKIFGAPKQFVLGETTKAPVEGTAFRKMFGATEKPYPKTVESVTEYSLSQKVFGKPKDVILGETPKSIRESTLFQKMFGAVEKPKKPFVVEETPVVQKIFGRQKEFIIGETPKLPKDGTAIRKLFGRPITEELKEITRIKKYPIKIRGVPEETPPTVKPTTAEINKIKFAEQAKEAGLALSPKQRLALFRQQQRLAKKSAISTEPIKEVKPSRMKRGEVLKKQWAKQEEAINKEIQKGSQVTKQGQIVKQVQKEQQKLLKPEDVFKLSPTRYLAAALSVGTRLAPKTAYERMQEQFITPRTTEMIQTGQREISREITRTVSKDVTKEMTKSASALARPQAFRSVSIERTAEAQAERQLERQLERQIETPKERLRLFPGLQEKPLLKGKKKTKKIRGERILKLYPIGQAENILASSGMGIKKKRQHKRK